MRALRTLPLTLGLTLPALGAGPWEGTVLPARQAEVPAAVTGRIAELKVKEGEAVKAGQCLVQLEGRLQELDLARAKALLERREFEAKGAKKLYDGKVIPEARALEARLEHELARLAVEEAAEQVRLRRIAAPFDGVVVDLRREVGEAVAPGQPVLRLVDLQRVLIQCAVTAREVSAFTVGRTVSVRFPHLEGVPAMKGEVVLVDPCADESGRFRVKVAVENPEGRLRAGLPARVLEPAEGR